MKTVQQTRRNEIVFGCITSVATVISLCFAVMDSLWFLPYAVGFFVSSLLIFSSVGDKP